MFWDFNRLKVKLRFFEVFYWLVGIAVVEPALIPSMWIRVIGGGF